MERTFKRVVLILFLKTATFLAQIKVKVAVKILRTRRRSHDNNPATYWHDDGTPTMVYLIKGRHQPQFPMQLKSSSGWDKSQSLTSPDSFMGNSLAKSLLAVGRKLHFPQKYTETKSHPTTTTIRSNQAILYSAYHGDLISIQFHFHFDNLSLFAAAL